MKLSEELKKRGFIHQHTSESLGDIVDGQKRVIYHGIDPTADSAHAGNMVIWMLLRHLANAGHKIIFLVGGGTGMIGDPKPDAERELRNAEVVDGNVQKIKAQAQMLIGGDMSQVEFVNNADWLLQQNLVTFLRDVGKHFTVNELIKKDAIASRLEGETGLSYTEFAYPLLQGFDYLTLFREKDCTLQVGGSDQWGNIVAGVDLIRKKEQQVVHAITAPLVVDKATGRKFGKSEGNAIWLGAEKTTPYQFYQFWLNTSDESVIDYLKLFTFMSLEDIAALEAEQQMNPGARAAQRRLADEVTQFVHGINELSLVQEVTGILFGSTPVSEISASGVSVLKKNAPYYEITPGTELVDILVACQLASSKREARTFIEGGAVVVDEVKVSDVEAKLTKTTVPVTLLRRGKKQMAVIGWGT